MIVPPQSTQSAQAMLLNVVEQGAFALWALVVLLAVREIRRLRKELTKRNEDDL